MGIVLFNTLSRKKERFAVPKSRAIKLYTCGPTVYRSQHIGNYRTFLMEDILKRTLLVNGYRIKHVMNITDVGHLVSDADTGEDKLAKEARRTGKSAWDIARTYEKEFKSELKKLNINPPTLLVRATDHIKEQIRLIQILERKGFTYGTKDGVYFNTSLVKKYGMLARRDASTIKAGIRVDIKNKRNPTDFALWKFSPSSEPKRQMEWSSPWGVGFPGWHIECSAMSMKYLGSSLDIHCGGWDHMQIHHPNEIAQSEAVTGKIFSRFWIHVAFLNVLGAKMAKSSPETFITLPILEAHGFSPLDLRYLVLGAHYRKQLSFSWNALKAASNARKTLIATFARLPVKTQRMDRSLKKNILLAINDDLNTPKALAILWKGIQKGASRNFILWADHVLGLAILKTSNKKTITPPLIVTLAKEREALRKEKRWREADEIRKKIEELGYRLEDTPSGWVIHKI